MHAEVGNGDRAAAAAIDYRCDDGKKKTVWFGATSWYHRVAEDSRIPKVLVIDPLKALVQPQTQKKKYIYPAWIVDPQPHLRIRLL
jgi:hypothetical protein